MQIVHDGKFLWLQRCFEIHGKTFEIVSFMQYLILLTSFMKVFHCKQLALYSMYWITFEELYIMSLKIKAIFMPIMLTMYKANRFAN